MAIAKAPLLSLGTRGRFAKTLTFANWKGLNIVKSYARPANPDTNAQRIHRAFWRQALYSWNHYERLSYTHPAWNKLAAYSHQRWCGYNHAIHALTAALRLHEHPSFLNSFANEGLETSSFELIDAKTGGNGVEAGWWEIWGGFNPRKLVLLETVYGSGPGVEFSTPMLAGESMWLTVRKDGIQRYGLSLMTAES